MRPPARYLTSIALLAASSAVAASEHDTGWFWSARGIAEETRPGASSAAGACAAPAPRCARPGRAWQLGAGYRITPYFSAEFEYGDVTERPTLDPLGLAPDGGPLVRGLNLSATATWQVMKRLDLYGRVGTSRLQTHEDPVVDSSRPSAESRVTMQLGAGMNYDISDRLGVRAEWERHTGLAGGPGRDSDEDVFSGYLRFRF